MDNAVIWGVCFRHRDGRTFIRRQDSEQGARHLVAVGRKGFDPCPVRVMRAEVGPWVPVDGEQQ